MDQNSVTLEQWVRGLVGEGTKSARKVLCTFTLGGGMPPEWCRGLAAEFDAGNDDEVLRLVEECTWYRAQQDITPILDLIRELDRD